jgi:hypothetical protein
MKTNFQDDEAFAFFLALVILHETVHYGNNLVGFQEDNIIFEGNVRDAGDAWIINATGMYINDISTAAIYLKKRP